MKNPAEVALAKLPGMTERVVDGLERSLMRHPGRTCSRVPCLMCDDAEDEQKELTTLVAEARTSLRILDVLQKLEIHHGRRASAMGFEDLFRAQDDHNKRLAMSLDARRRFLVPRIIVPRPLSWWQRRWRQLRVWVADRIG